MMVERFFDTISQYFKIIPIITIIMRVRESHTHIFTTTYQNMLIL